MQTISGFDKSGSGERYYSHTDFNEIGRTYFRFLCTELGREPKDEFDVDVDLKIVVGSYHKFYFAHHRAVKAASEGMTNCELDDESREFWAFIDSGLKSRQVLSSAVRE